eukprot:3673911-Amphidinium_carterae.1
MATLIASSWYNAPHISPRKSSSRASWQLSNRQSHKNICPTGQIRSTLPFTRWLRVTQYNWRLSSNKTMYEFHSDELLTTA